MTTNWALNVPEKDRAMFHIHQLYCQDALESLITYKSNMSVFQVSSEIK